MNKSLFLIPLLLVLTAGIVLAAPMRESIRASGGVVNYLGDVTSFESVKTSFSAWYSGQRGDQGLGNVIIEGVTSEGDRVSFRVSLRLKQVIANTDDRLYVDNTATGTYWKSGVGRKKVEFSTLRYDLNKVTETVNVAGEGVILPSNRRESETPLTFRITGMQVTSLIGFPPISQPIAP